MTKQVEVQVTKSGRAWTYNIKVDGRSVEAKFNLTKDEAYRQGAEASNKYR